MTGAGTVRRDTVRRGQRPAELKLGIQQSSYSEGEGLVPWGAVMDSLHFGHRKNGLIADGAQKLQLQGIEISDFFYSRGIDGLGGQREVLGEEPHPLTYLICQET